MNYLPMLNDRSADMLAREYDNARNSRDRERIMQLWELVVQGRGFGAISFSPVLFRAAQEGT